MEGRKEVTLPWENFRLSFFLYSLSLYRLPASSQVVFVVCRCMPHDFASFLFSFFNDVEVAAAAAALLDSLASSSFKRAVYYQMYYYRYRCRNMDMEAADRCVSLQEENEEEEAKEKTNVVRRESPHVTFSRALHLFFPFNFNLVPRTFVFFFNKVEWESTLLLMVRPFSKCTSSLLLTFNYLDALKYWKISPYRLLSSTASSI